MINLSHKQMLFLENSRNVNQGQSVIKGYPASTYKAMEMDENLNMIKICSGHVVDGGNQGFKEDESFYLNLEKGADVLEMLVYQGVAELNTEGIYVFASSQWNGAKNAESTKCVLIQKGNIQGMLRQKDHVFEEDQMQFTPSVKGLKLISSKPILHQTIDSIIMAYKDNVEISLVNV